MLVLRFGGGEFALDLGEVGEIVRFESHSPAWPVPGAPGAVHGLIEVRGRIVTLLDPAALFGLPSPPGAAHATGILLAGRYCHLGLLADEAAGIVSGPAGDDGPLVLTGAEIESRASALVHAGYRLAGGAR
jgi:purine-binding chemotaxis protein CheW